MSRRKDRERFMAMKQLNPDYVGFRGYGQDSTSSSEPPLEKVTCSRCGRTRNVPVGVAADHQDDYVCATCQEELGEESAETAPAEEEKEEETAVEEAKEA